MKAKRILGGLVSLGLVVGLTLLFAAVELQATLTQATGKETKTHDKLQAALDSMNLTEDQRAKVKDVLADAKTKHHAVSTDTSLTDEQKKAKMKELHEGMMSKLNEVLTPEQQTELKSKMTPAKEKMPQP